MVTRAERASSFGSIAEDYDRLRPGPPPAAVSWLLPDHCATAVDLAAGTGLVSRVLTGLCSSGAGSSGAGSSGAGPSGAGPSSSGSSGTAGRVVAVEPDPRMAAVLRARSAGVAVVRGVGEAIPLAAASVDAVLISSAWHWLDPARAIPELARVLRAGGRLGVLRTGIDLEVGWLRELRPPDRSGRTEQLHDSRGSYQSVPRTGQFGAAAEEVFTFTRTMSVTEFIGLLSTYSAYITASEQDRTAGLARVRSELDLMFPGDGPIEVPMRTRCWRADRVSEL